MLLSRPFKLFTKLFAFQVIYVRLPSYLEFNELKASDLKDFPS